MKKVKLLDYVNVLYQKLNHEINKLKNQKESPKDFLIFKDEATNYEYELFIDNGELKTRPLGKKTVFLNKTTFIDGQTINLENDVVLKNIYPDGSEEEIEKKSSEFKIIPSIVDANTTSVEVHYKKEIFTFAITVTEFDPTVELIDFTYTDNGNGTYTITGWNGTYQGENSTEIIIPDNNHIIL